MDSFSCSITSTMTCFLTNRSLVYFYHLANEVAKGYSNATVRPSFRKHPCEHSRINVLQWILIKLGTYLVLKRIWNPIDFQGHRSKVKGQGHQVKFLGEGIRHALRCPCYILILVFQFPQSRYKLCFRQDMWYFC